MIRNIIHDKAGRLFVVLGGFFIANALIAEVIGVKIFSLEDTIGIPKFEFTLLGVEGLSFDLPVGVIPWPVIFIMTDIINEYYGVKGVKFLTFLTTFLIAFAFLIFYLAIKFSPETNWWITSYAEEGVPDMQAAFTAIFGQGMNIIIGSITAFIIGQIADAFIFRSIKRITGEKKIWMRATVSTLFSQFIDSFIVIYIAFYLFRDVSFAVCTALALTSYSYKFVVAVLFTPFVYLIHWMVEQYLGKEKAAEMKVAALLSR
jgi:uncharacterized integral membrane protein (TIGR00697 family)